MRRRPRTHAGPALDRNSLCVRATLLFARWQRCGQGRIGLALGCVCAGDAAIDVAMLDGMILDHLQQRFAHQGLAARRFTSPAVAGSHSAGCLHHHKVIVSRCWGQLQGLLVK